MATISFEDYYNQHRTAAEPDHSFIRATANASTAVLKRAQKRHAEEIAAKADEKERLLAEYQTKVLRGEIAEPSRIERLIQTARGHEDLESVQAARRLLQKYGVSREES